MTPTSPRNASLDALRVLCLLGIITLHVAGGGFADNKPLRFVVDELSRFAVPVFFLMSAYFWKEADLASPLRLVAKVARRVLPAFALVLVLTIGLRLLEHHGPGFDRSLQGVLLLLWTGGPAFHLWFLPALVLGTAIVATLLRWTGLRTTLAVVLVLYVVGTLIGAYSKPLLGHGFPFWMDRNGLFFAPVFLAAGIVLRRDADRLRQIPVAVTAVAVVTFAALHVAEGYFVVGRYALGHDYSLATLGYALSVAILFTRLELKSPLWSALGQATFGAYLIHLLVLDTLANDLKLGGNSWLLIALCFCTSLGIATTFRAGRALLASALVRA